MRPAVAWLLLYGTGLFKCHVLTDGDFLLLLGPLKLLLARPRPALHSTLFFACADLQARIAEL